MLQSENPERRPVWTALYYDLTAEQWVVTYEVPVDLDGRHLVNPSFDVLLNDMMDRLISEHLPGSRNFIVSPDGHLIAHPNRMTGDKQDKGQIDIEETGDPVLIGMFESIHAAAPSPSDGKVWIADATEHDAFIAVAELAGPGWWFAAAYPKKLVAAEAHRSASVILILGVVLLVLLMTIVFVILRRDVARPLEVLKNASERITRGDESRVAEGGVPFARISAQRDRAAGPFVPGHGGPRRRRPPPSLEAEVAERTEELREANRRLEELSLLDPLTGAHNRRALDHDLAAAVAQARRETQPFALLMCDVDLFKPFNDTYGHDMGDKVLREVVACLCKTVREGDRVYRYGGEEIAIILRGANIEDARWIADRLVQRVVRPGRRACTKPLRETDDQHRRRGPRRRRNDRRRAGQGPRIPGSTRQRPKGETPSFHETPLKPPRKLGPARNAGPSGVWLHLVPNRAVGDSENGRRTNGSLFNDESGLGHKNSVSPDHRGRLKLSIFDPP